MPQFRRSFSGAPWESRVGYCRSLRAGDSVFVTGTAPVAEDGGVHAVGDGYRQAVRCFDIIREALAAQGAELSHVVRTRRSLPTSSDGRNSAGRIKRPSASTLLRPRWSK